MTGGSTDIRAQIGYCRETGRRPFFYANAHEKDFVPLAPVEVHIADARGRETSLDREGFTLVEHRSAVADLTDLDAVAAVHAGEISALLTQLTGADLVDVGPRGILRFSERAGANDAHDNSHPARFAHVDMSISAAEHFRGMSAPEGQAIARSAQYNVWRVLSQPPQDVPLALLDWSSMELDDLIDCEAIFDPPGGAPEWRFDNYLIGYSPRHRWNYFSAMHPGEAIVFKTSDSREDVARMMPHGAFDNPLVGEDAPPRISLEMRGTAYWFA